MTLLAALFTLEELNELDEKKLHILKHLIEKEIASNEDIRRPLKDVVKRKYFDPMTKRRSKR
jgi:hypothetical protein